METYTKDFSIVGDFANYGNSELEEVITNRQNKYRESAQYKKASDEIKASLNEIKKDFPTTKGTIGDLEDRILDLECICYSAAYRDGMNDLMVAMTFNELQITHSERVVIRENPLTQQRKADQ